MPSLLRPTETHIVNTKEIHTHTKQGECKVVISLDLNININSDGVTVKEARATAVEDDDSVDWAIGNFAPKKKVKFGKRVQE